MNAYIKSRPTLRQKRQAVQRWFVSTSCRAVLLGCMVLFGILYLAKVNSVSTQGLVISDLEDAIVELERDNKKLDVQIASYRSMQSVESRLGNMNLVAAGEKQYVTSVGTAVARR